MRSLLLFALLAALAGCAEFEKPDDRLSSARFGTWYPVYRCKDGRVSDHCGLFDRAP
jgi:hypothetical protein